MCEHLNIDGANVIICGARRKRQFCACGRACDFLCDWKVRDKKSGTCDAPICARHAKEVAPGKHLCPLHQHMWDDWQRKHPGAAAPKQPSLFEGVA